MNRADDRLLRRALEILDGAGSESDARVEADVRVEPDALAGDEASVQENLGVLARIARLRGPAAAAGSEGVSSAEVTQAASPELDREPSEDQTPLPTRWGAFEIEAQIGQGGFGRVYRAMDPKLERHVALKLVESSPPAAGDLSRSVREGRLLARVRHPHVVTVYGADQFDGQVGIWMELVRGRTLDELIAEGGPLSDREAAAIGIDMAQALAAVHAAGIVHQDVKARNVMREEGGRILLMDFGAGHDRAGATPPGAALSGTPLYLAPELLDGAQPTVQSDIYALGVLLYYLVTGTHPVSAPSLLGLKSAHQRGERIPLRSRRADLPLAFVQVVERALAVDPRRRFASAAEIEAALAGGGVASERVPGRLRSKRQRLAAGAVIALAVVVIIAFGWPAVRRAGTGSFALRADFLKLSPSGQRPLQADETLALNDGVQLRVEASRPVYFYLFNYDAKGQCFWLFPERPEQNPLPPGSPCFLPAPGKHWKVTSRGGEETFVYVASRLRLEDLEARLSALPRPQGAMAGSAVAQVFRGLGLIDTHAPTPAEAVPAAEQILAAISDVPSGAVSTNGVLVRRQTFRNP